MKNFIPFELYLILLLFLLTTLTCKKDELVKVTKLETGSVTDITYSTAKAGATFSDLSGNVTEFGHCWNTSGNPTTSDPKSIVGSIAKKGDFSSNLTGLSAGTRYYVKAYAIDGGKPVYGNQEEFTTNSLELPVLTTKEITAISYATASSGGEISSDGGSSITARGVCWSTSENPTVTSYSGKTNDGTGTGAFNSNLTGLTNNTTYYVRAYATNSEGTAYGNQQNFTTDAYSLPTVTTDAISSITHNSAVSGGNVTSDGGSTVTARGVCWGTSENPTLESALDNTTDGNGTGSFDSNITGLNSNSDYHVRAYATNGVGTNYGTNIQFSTTTAPSISITSPNTGDHWIGLEPVNITWTSSNLSGNLSISLYKGDNYFTDISSNTENDGLFTWSSVIDGQDDNDYKIRITSLENTGLFVESNSFTISESNGSTGTIKDWENNTYNTIKIGEQWWMAENLNSTLNSVGDPINGYFAYQDDPQNRNDYGLLYSKHAILQSICPVGWHVPSDEEWMKLESYIGMDEDKLEIGGWRGSNEGGKLKSLSTLWNTPNNSALNTYNFSAEPGGQKTSYWNNNLNIYMEVYWFSGTSCYFWTKSTGEIYIPPLLHLDMQIIYRQLDYDEGRINRDGITSETSLPFEHNPCYSVRCIKN